MTETAKKIRKTIALATISFVISIAAAFSGVLNLYELRSFDLLSRNLNPTGTSDNIVIVTVDQKSLDALSAQSMINWPWPRQVYAPILEYLSAADAVFVDIFFTEPSSYGVEDDLLFSKAISEVGNVYFPVGLTNGDAKLNDADRKFIKEIAVRADLRPNLAYKSAITPLDIYETSVKGGGNVMITPDEDGVYRRIPLVFGLDHTVVPQFVMNYLLRAGLVTIKQDGFYVRDTNIPAVKNVLLLRYNRDKVPFITISAIDIINSYLEKDPLKKPLMEKGFFKGKKVFIGYTAPGLYDLKPTSLSSFSTGVHINATALDNILNRTFIRPLHDIYLVIFMLLICYVISHFVLRYHSVYISLSIFSLAAFAGLLIPVALFMNGLYIKILFPLLSVGISFVVAAGYSYSTEGKERRFIKRTFMQYMDKNIVEYILKYPEVIKPGGQRRRVTIFFTDLAGFTTLAESLPPQQSVMILHTIFNSFTEVIIQNKGVIDKYIGDAIMAFWGAPLETDNDEINACRAALQCVEKLQGINEDYKDKGWSRVDVRIGVHTGDAVVGNMGSDRLFDYTVIGDTVNLASRLESVNKVFRTHIIISDDTLKKTDQHFFVRDLGLIEVKGKTKAVNIFELLGETSEALPEKRQAVEVYHRGLAFYREGNWDKAIRNFDTVLASHPDDGPSLFYRARCEQQRTDTRLTGNWDVVKMTDK
jgi:adenylate cyclase